MLRIDDHETIRGPIVNDHARWRSSVLVLSPRTEQPIMLQDYDWRSFGGLRPDHLSASVRFAPRYRFWHDRILLTIDAICQTEMAGTIPLPLPPSPAGSPVSLEATPWGARWGQASGSAKCSPGDGGTIARQKSRRHFGLPSLRECSFNHYNDSATSANRWQ